MINRILPLCLLSLCFATGCSSMLARTSRLSPSGVSGGTPPERGLQVTKVFPGSPAEEAGLRWPDIITKYGEFEIVDDAGFFAAKNHYAAAHVPTVEIVVWRGLTRMSAQVRTGWLGVHADENDKVSRQFMSLMRKINAMRELPPYMLEREFKETLKESPSQILGQAKELIDQAERDGTLTPAQIHLDRIYMILDDAPPEELRRLDDLLQQLIASQPANYIEMLGSDRFFKDKRYRAAIACFKEHLKRSSDDVSIRLNLGVAYNKVGMYSEAQSAADYVFENKLGLSEYGHSVGYTVKATAAMGLKDYKTSIKYAKLAFAIDRRFYPMSLVQLAAARTGELKLLEQATRQLQQTSPDEYEKMRIQSDAVTAYALVQAKRRDAARKIVQQWESLDVAEGKVIDYWRIVPDGIDVAKTFGELLKS